MDKLPVRLTGGRVSIIAVGAGDGAVSNASTLHTLSLNLTAVIKKIMWFNRTGGNVLLWIGYNDLTVAAAVFRQVLPSIFCVNGMDGELNEDDLPICGNTPLGFHADITAVTGSLGNIMGEVSNSAAAPNDFMVQIEVEEY